MDKAIPQEAKMIPDTLDLAERGSLAINGALGTLDPDCGFEPYFLTYFNVHPAYMLHWSSMPSGVLPKYVESMPLLRLMSGSDQDRDIEEGMLASIASNISEDGLIYDRATPERPWNVGFGYGPKNRNEDFANMAGNGRLVIGLVNYYQATGDEIWKRSRMWTDIDYMIRRALEGSAAPATVANRFPCSRTIIRRIDDQNCKTGG